MYQVTTPVREFNGCVAGVWFVNGEATTDNEGAVAYFQRHGYTVTPLDDPARVPAGFVANEKSAPAKPAPRPRSKQRDSKEE